MKKLYELDSETVDGITVCNLKKYREYLQSELDNYDTGGYLHEEDVTLNKKLIHAMDLIIT